MVEKVKLEQTVESSVQIRRDGCLDVDRQLYGGLITDEQAAITSYQDHAGIKPKDGELIIDLAGLDFKELKGYLGEDYQPGQELPEAAAEYLNTVFEANQDKYEPVAEIIDFQPPGLSERIDQFIAEYRVEKAMLDIQHKLREDHLARKTDHFINQQLRMAGEENVIQYRADMKSLDDALGKQQEMMNQDGLLAFTLNKGAMGYELRPYRNPMQQAA